MRSKPNYGSLDRFRMLAALLVVAIHTSPLTSVSEGADFFLTRILARLAVPFFFMVTGQFVASGLLKPPGKVARYHKFLKKTALLYAFSILLYLPIGVYAGHYEDMTFSAGLRMLLFDGTFYHLWYFPACILGMLLVRLMSRFLSLQGMTAVSAVLYVIGLFGDSYFGLVQKAPALNAAYEFSFGICSYTRNGLFFAPLFLVLGAWMAVLEKKRKRLASPLPLYIGLALSFGLMTAEGFLLRHFELQRHDSMYFALVPTMFFLYRCLLYPHVKSARYFRNASMWIYVLHPAFIVVVRGLAKPLKLTELLVENSLVHYLAVALSSAAAGLLLAYVQTRLHLALPGKGPKEVPQKASASRKRPRPVSGGAKGQKPWDSEAQETDSQADYGFAREDSQEENGLEDLDFQSDGGFTDSDFQSDGGFADSGFQGDDGFADSGFQGDEGFADSDFQGDDDLTDFAFQGDGGFADSGFQGDGGFADSGFQSDGGFADSGFQGDGGFADSGFQGDGGFADLDFQDLDGSADFEFRPKGDGNSLAKGELTDLDFPAEDGLQHTDSRTHSRAVPSEDVPRNARSRKSTDWQKANDPTKSAANPSGPISTRYMSESVGQNRPPSQEINPRKEGEIQTRNQKEADHMPNHYNREPLLPPEDTPWSPDSPGGKTAPASRAWIELDTAALEQNVNFLRSRLPEHCRLMPAVKAQAYGHGAALISRQLNRLGVDAFCVACVSEGIELREAGVQGEILILGYTSPEDFPLLCGYGLTQTVIDYPYAQELNRFGQTLHVHIGVDTGMHRVGIRCEKIEEIAAVYQMENLTVDGIFTHLCASDSPHPDHRSFTKSQVLAFGQVVDILQEQGLPCPGQHLLASYGILNLLPDRAWHEGPVPPVGNRGGLDGDRLAADYVRPGIVLYGVLGSQTDLDVWKDFLRPVLSLKAKVASIRPLYAGESVGYGITYTAEKNMKIAAVTIGYGDGLPRELSNGKGSVLIHGHRAPIVGRICMDQTIVDISGIPHVHAGDDAVIIGSSGTLEITAGQIAEQCGTITHEILTGLAPRLDRIWV